MTTKKTNWNLKDCKKSTYNMFIGHSSTLIGKEDYHYTANDIETLRQKLIEDIYDHYWETLESDKEIAIKHMASIINKRFGYDG